MNAVRFAIPVIALVLGAWFTFDGSRAFLRGNYVTARTGPHQGQLGPWAKCVAAVGFEPRGVFIKSVHVFLGLLWIVSAGLFVVRPGTGWYAVLGSSVLSLWYVPLGTVLSIVELVLLFLPVARALK